MIEARNLVKRYGGFLAVDHLSFTVGDRQIYGLLGQNGAGKSTTMNMLTGYLSATEGNVLIDGRDLWENPKSAMGFIGYLPEIPPVYPDMTPMEYLKFAGGLKKIPGRQRAEEARRVMRRMEIDTVQNKLIKSLSKGYRQRVGFACALLGDPSNIILDEPTVGMDPRQIMEVRDLIRELGSGRTVILSSHILSEISAVCDQVLILSGGRLVASESPDELRHRMSPSNVYQMRVEGEAAKIRQLLGQLKGLRALEVTAEEKNRSAVRIETEADCDPREEVFYLLANARCPILELSAAALTLEDVFLELTQTEGGQPFAAVHEEGTLPC